MKTVTEILKLSCKKAHIKTEKTLVEKFKSINNLDDYTNILTTFYGYFAPVENEIEKHITNTILPDIELRKRSSFIISDLRNLNYTRPLPVAGEIPLINSYLQAAGAMYVLEGSTMGGQHIVQMLIQKPALQERKDAMSFFKGYEEQNMLMWQIFKDHLDTNIHEKDVEEVVQSAIETFVLLDKWTLNKNNDGNKKY
ncbi:biliverdin-producing heme oxygenase [Segetibacter koreensis]|uniref:biliverdin-producing heme oxygenase n=1 Tax=Segetibacter koreensis TaxID=398037 RepID=UPI00036F2F8D|nr:biliverdin-producing heme oxygenase [Segetibacter koreensis]